MAGEEVPGTVKRPAELYETPDAKKAARPCMRNTRKIPQAKVCCKMKTPKHRSVRVLMEGED